MLSTALAAPESDRLWMRLLRSPRSHLTLILCVYAALLLPTLERQGILWDEQNDLWIAQAYLQPGGWLAGSILTPSQARLPMFCAALYYAITGTANLVSARWASALVGGLALAGVFVYTRRRYSSTHAVLAAGLLATSPFYLSFARVAFTEGDIYPACALAWLLVALDRLHDRPTVGRAALAGLVLGLAIATKFTALALLPGVWLAVCQAPEPVEKDRAPAPQIWSWAGWCAAVLAGGLGLHPAITAESYTPTVRAAHYTLATLGWLLPLGWAVRNRSRCADPKALAGWLIALGLLTSFILPPEHLTNPSILASLFRRAGDEMGFDLAFMGEAVALHVLSVLFKSTPIIGSGLLAGWIVASLQWRNPARRTLLLLSAGYAAGLLVLPIAQTFYAVPVLPVLAICAADLSLHLWRRWRRWGLACGLIAGLAWGVEMAQCYPDYNLNGYQWLGARPLAGRSSIGYRSVVQTSSDGVQQVIEWINARAVPGETVQVYALPWHIVLAVAGKPVYRLQRGLEHGLNAEPDYVVVHINALIWHGWHGDTPRGEVIRYPYDPVKLQQEYEKAFGVPRAFGLEAASVWRRRSTEMSLGRIRPVEVM